MPNSHYESFVAYFALDFLHFIFRLLPPHCYSPTFGSRFMDSYGRDYATYMGSVSLYLGDLVNDSNSAGYSSSDGGTKYREWFADFHAVAYKSFGYFSLGRLSKFCTYLSKWFCIPLFWCEPME